MEPYNAHYADQVCGIFKMAPHIRNLGIDLVAVTPGQVLGCVRLKGHLLQQHGFAHAGVQATLADHCAGGAATTLIRVDQACLSAEFKINLLRPARGEYLSCRATVLKSGRVLVVTEAEVFAHQGPNRCLVAKATVTLAVVEKPS